MFLFYLSMPCYYIFTKRIIQVVTSISIYPYMLYCFYHISPTYYHVFPCLLMPVIMSLPYLFCDVFIEPINWNVFTILSIPVVMCLPYLSIHMVMSLPCLSIHPCHFIMCLSYTPYTFSFLHLVYPYLLSCFTTRFFPILSDILKVLIIYLCVLM